MKTQGLSSACCFLVSISSLLGSLLTGCAAAVSESTLLQSLANQNGYQPLPLPSSLASGAINNGVIASGYSAVHLVNPTYGPTHAPVANLVKIGTAEYATGFLLSDGTIHAVTGTTTPMTIMNPTGITFVDYSGGLHQSIATDSNGHVWTWGGNTNGISGTGSDGADINVPQEILTDINGQSFTNVVMVKAGGWQGSDSDMASGALKSDGTLWIWGECPNGQAGNGTLSNLIERPTQVPFPSGVHIQKFLFGADILLALDTNGGVWSWGGSGDYQAAASLGRAIPDNGLSPGQVLGLPTNITDIVSGGNFSYALTSTGQLYAWGENAEKLGQTGNNLQPVPTPQNMQTILNLQASVKAIAANNTTVHVILTDGTMWGWGDDAQGEVGDGQELDYSKPNPNDGGYYAWDWGLNQLSVRKPVQIAPQIHNWESLYTNAAYVFYVFAVTADGNVYSWGRNKTGNLMNGIVPPRGGDISATYPNSWDVLVPQHINLFEVTQSTQVTSPYCLIFPNGSPCNEF